MKIMVVGAGQVGTSVAKGLDDTHEIVVVDADAETLDQLRYGADVMTYEGDAADIDVLEKAGAADTDLLVASTNDDRTNILVCAVAKVLADDLVSVARVADTDFLKSWEHSKNAFNVDWMVGSDYVTAQTLVQLGLRYGAQTVEYFLQGRIEVVEFQLPPGSDLDGQTVREADIYPELRYIAITDGEDFEVVRGDTVIPPESRILVMGRSREVDRLAHELDPEQRDPVNRIIILGGGEIGFQTARLYQNRGLSPKIIEQDGERANFLARNLPDCFVLRDDALDPDFLQSEGIDRTDLVVSALRPDERNLFASLQARQLGAERVISVVHEQKYASLFANNGVTATVNPRTKVIEEILQCTRDGRVEKITFVEGHDGEVLEVELEEGSVLLGRPLKKSAADLPDGMVVGAVARGSKTIIPTGDTTFEVGDHLVIYVDTEDVEEVVEKV
jgi:trk system potassium uptake protein TrkA